MDAEVKVVRAWDAGSPQKPEKLRRDSFLSIQRNAVLPCVIQSIFWSWVVCVSLSRKHTEMQVLQSCNQQVTNAEKMK
jgi:hypothetical protein